MRQFFLSCDWGTSSFRLRLVNIRDNQVMGELLTNGGVAATHRQWMEAAQMNRIPRVSFFFRQLKLWIDELFETINFRTDVESVIISGMASSSMGLIELPYAKMPFSLDGSNIQYKYFESSDEFPHNTWLISGLSSDTDVMRGEETQMIGLAEGFTSQDREDLVCIIPGTHSKHIQVENYHITGVETYITGELFYLMTQYSVLRECVDEFANTKSLSGACAEAFEKGVASSAGSNFLNTAFSIRVNHLFGKFQKSENSFYLSGLLIGMELESLKKYKTRRIMLAGEQPLLMLYEKALKLLDIVRNTYVVDPEIFNRAVINAHMRLLKTIWHKAA